MRFIQHNTSGTSKTQRKGVASVEFAVCLPVLLTIGFGFINIGQNIQFKYNSKLIGHLAATECFKKSNANSETRNQIENEFESVSRSLGLKGLSVRITQENDEIAVVRTALSTDDNSSVPVIFRTNLEITTETFVYSPR